MSFNQAEKRVVYSVGGIFLLRMLGLFLLIPVLKVYSLELEVLSTYRLGLAMGIYGLMQALFQIPFGFLSDKIGRQKTVLLGLSLFFLGSLCAAVFKQIEALILGRALQGMGAVGSVLMASLGDLTRESVRPYAMACVGLSIGLAFILSLLLAPLLFPIVGVSGLFWGMTLATFFSLWFIYRTTPLSLVDVKIEPFGIRFINTFSSICEKKAFRYSLMAIFITHAMLAVFFLVLPRYLYKYELGITQHWQFYFPVALLGLGLSGFGLRRLNTPLVLGKVLKSAIVMLILSFVLISAVDMSFTALCMCSAIFFMAFGLLEAGLPAFTTSVVSSQMRGTAMGIYSSAQFLGFFAGGMLGAWFSHGVTV